MKLFRNIVATPKALNQWLNQNQNAPSHWRVLVYFGWSTLGLLAMWVASTPWPWLKADLPDRTEEAIAITATLGAFIVPLVLTVVQNAFRSAPAFSARLYLFVRYSRATELAQGFILLAGLGLFLSLAPPSPVTNLLTKWHFLLTAIAIGWTIWFIKEAMRFSNHHERDAIILAYLKKKPLGRLAFKKGADLSLLQEVMEEISAELPAAAKATPRTEYKDKLNAIEELGDTLLSKGAADSDFAQSLGTAYDFFHTLLRDETVPAFAIGHFYSVIFGNPFAPKRVSRTLVVHRAASNFWRSLLPSDDPYNPTGPIPTQRHIIAVNSFCNAWRDWVYNMQQEQAGAGECLDPAELTFQTLQYYISAEEQNDELAAHFAVDFFTNRTKMMLKDEHSRQLAIHARVVGAAFWLTKYMEPDPDSAVSLSHKALIEGHSITPEGELSQFNQRPLSPQDILKLYFWEICDPAAKLLHGHLRDAKDWSSPLSLVREHENPNPLSISGLVDQLAMLMLLTNPTGNCISLNCLEQYNGINNGQGTLVIQNLNMLAGHVGRIDQRTIKAIAEAIGVDNFGFDQSRTAAQQALNTCRNALRNNHNGEA